MTGVLWLLIIALFLLLIARRGSEDHSSFYLDRGSEESPEFSPYGKRLYGEPTNYAEQLVSNSAIRRLSTQYCVLNDLLLPSNGRISRTQIDHVIISPYGIFCIETKAHQGWIWGHAEKSEWLQTFSRHSSFELNNPVAQNRGHKIAIERAIAQPLLKRPAISIVVFPFADKLFVRGTNRVTDIDGMFEIISKCTEPVYTKAQCVIIRDRLLRLSTQDAGARSQHIDEVRRLAIS